MSLRRMGNVTRHRGYKIVALLAISLLGQTTAATYGSTGSADRGAGQLDSCLSTPENPPNVPAVTAPPGTAEEANQYAVAERTMFALDPSQAAIQAASSNPNATDIDLGTPLTASEVQTLANYDSLIRSGDSVDLFAQNHVPNNYSGTYVDPANHSLVEVIISNNDCDLLTQIQTHFASMTVQGVPALNNVSLSTLKQEYQALNDHTDDLWSQGVIYDTGTLNLLGNSLDIRLDPASAANSVAQITAAIGSQGVNITWDGVPLPGGTINRENPPKTPVYAGEDITDGELYCTSNISVQSDVHTYVTTAGHCFSEQFSTISQNCDPDDANVYCDNKKIGGFFSGTPPLHSTYCDCGLSGSMNASRATSSELKNGNTPYAMTNYALSNGYYRYGRPACMSGFVEYHFVYGHIICGIISASSISGRYFEPYQWFALDQFTIKYPDGVNPQGGDSGAPVASAHVLLGVNATKDENPGWASKAKYLHKVFPSVQWMVPSI